MLLRFFFFLTVGATLDVILTMAGDGVLGAVPHLSANPDHLLLCFTFLTVGVALLILTVAAYYGRMAQRVRDAFVLVVAPQEEHDGPGALWFFFRSRTLCAAAFFLLWGASSIVLGAVPHLSANPDHLLLCFTFLTIGVALLILTVAAPREAARLEGWLMAAMP